MAGLQEVLTASGSGDKQIWTLLPEGDATAPPETRVSDSVDSLLESVASCLNCAPTAMLPHVLLPGGEGAGTVAGADAVVLFCGKEGAPNVKATALLVAAGVQDAAATSVRGAVCVARFQHDLANPLAVQLGKETAPAFLAERCWLQRARGDTQPETQSPFPRESRQLVLAQLLQARASEIERRKTNPGMEVRNMGGRVRWVNEKDNIHVAAQLPAGTNRGHCRVAIEATKLTIKVGEVDAGGTFRLASLIDGTLFQEVDVIRCGWDFVETTALGTAELQVTLRKKEPMRWLMLVR